MGKRGRPRSGIIFPHELDAECAEVIPMMAEPVVPVVADVQVVASACFRGDGMHIMPKGDGHKVFRFGRSNGYRQYANGPDEVAWCSERFERV
jgi:hypothetical protein